MPLTGIDVSHLQNLIDWNSVTTGGFSFAFAKATEGLTITDAQFHANWAGMASANLFRGAYHFFHPNDDASAQAQHFLAALTAANGSPTLAPGDLPCVLDVEVANNQSPATVCAGVQTWLDVVQAATGRIPIIYTGPLIWTTLTGGSTAFSGYPLWVAEYGVSKPKPTAGWTDYTFWQNSESQTVVGIDVPTDGDLFNGSLTDLQTLASITI